MERMSALMDGELEDEEVPGMLEMAKRDKAARDAWTTYHIIGEALRGERVAQVELTGAVASRLAQEPTVLAPRRGKLVPAVRRYTLPGLAAAAAVATVTWVSLGNQTGPAGSEITPAAETIIPVTNLVAPTPITQLVQPAALSSPAPAIVFPSRSIDVYLQAHNEFSPSRTIQGLAAYARNVANGSNEPGR